MVWRTARRSSARTPVDSVLHTAADGLKEREAHQRRGGDGELGSGRERTQQRLQRDDADEECQRDRGARSTVYEGAVDQKIDVIEAVSQYRDTNRDRRRDEGNAVREVADRAIGSGNASRKAQATEHHAADEPLELLALGALGSACPVPQCAAGEDQGEQPDDRGHERQRNNGALRELDGRGILDAGEIPERPSSKGQKRPTS